MNGLNSLKDLNLKTKAAEDEIELTVFGRGFGECIIIKYSSSDYAIIDCFKDPDTDEPIVFEYFKLIQEPLNKIKRIIITHWHQDHIAGISDVISKSAEDVKIVISPIISDKDYRNYISMSEENNCSNEFSKVMQLLNENNASFAIKDKLLCGNSNTMLKALSPVDAELHNYIRDIQNRLNKKDVSFAVPDENGLSLALLFKYKGNGILLGGDMENHSNPNFGWNGIISDFNDTKSKIFKIPHHGSKTAENKKIWTDLLEPLPVSILTTFNKGYGLPTEEDIARIKEQSRTLYVIGSEGKRNRTIENFAKIIKISAKSISQQVGLVRYRYNIKTLEEKFEHFGKVNRMNNSKGDNE